MSETPGSGLEEEPQEERGPKGSRDADSDPSGGSVGRPVGTADADDDTSIEAEEPIDPESPDLQSGGG